MAQAGAYRADIDGLRAIAVVAVVCFHAVPGALPGGFIGVDIFFVISGFLITQILTQRLNSGAFSFAEFYARRVRRILPALAVVLSFCLAFGWLVLLTDEFRELGLHVLTAGAFVSNLQLWQEAGYFDKTAELKPLLHLWSLGIEEQFYLVWPLVLCAAWRCRIHLAAVCAALLLISFALNICIVPHNPAAAFYSPPTRVWELMIGATLACGLRLPIPISCRPYQGLAGLAMIAAGALLINQAVLFPGYWALLPTLGTALILDSRSCIHLLSGRVLVSIGLISYPLYLWHWPLLSFARIISGEALPVQTRVAIIAISFGLAIGTYALVERPIRRRVPRRTMLAGLGSSLAALAVAGFTIYSLGGLPGRIPPAVVQFAEAANDVNPDRGKCILREPTNVLTGNFCRLGKNYGSTPSLMVWGDSHADPWMPVFNDLATRNGIAGLIASHAGCAPLLGVNWVGAGGKCVEFNKAVFAEIAKFKIKEVVLAGRWSWYIYGGEEGGVEPDPGPIPIIAKIDDSERNAAAVNSRKHAFREGIAMTVSHLRSIGAHVWILDQPPTYKVQVPKFLAYSALTGKIAKGRLREEVQQRHQFQLDVFQQNGIDVLGVAQYLCPSEETHCRLEVGGKSLYRDYNHLSVFGAQTIAKWAEPLLTEVIVNTKSMSKETTASVRM
jgi:peptidoglycan/LPS O-acetylase OafA/YrhL